MKNQVLLHGLCKVTLYTIDMTLGKRIKAARRRIGMTQTRLGEFFGISYQAVSQWERDETVPDARRLDMLAHVLRVSTDALLTGKEREIDAA